MTRTRIAPSPTGEDLHIGNLHTALFNWTWATKNQGQFIVRIEDTDRTRLVTGSEEKILKTLKDYGLESQEDPVKGGPYAPYRQSERLDQYLKYAEELIGKGAAYRCYCTKERLEQLRQKQIAEGKVPKYDKHCLKNIKNQSSNVKSEPYVIRLNVPENKEVSFQDVVRGKITFNTSDIDDTVLMKSDGFPTYHLAVVIDDHLMKISHVIRGEEWISSTPKHILLYEAFSWEKPIYCHTPLLRNPDKSKLSKRKNPVWASWYLEQGYLPEAVLNFLALMGWSHPEGKEIFSLEEFVQKFTLDRIAAAGPVFDLAKLEWMNGEYIRGMEPRNLKFLISNFYSNKYPEDLIERTIPLIQERIKTLKEYDDYCRFFIEALREYEIDLSKYTEMLKNVSSGLEQLDEWKADKIGEVMQQVASESGLKNSEFFMAVRVAITGKKVSPPLNESMEILGKSESLNRLRLVGANPVKLSV